MALDQGLNRDSKMKGGIIGVSHDENAVEKWTITAHRHNENAVEKWTITAHLRAAVTSNSKVMSELKKK